MSETKGVYKIYDNDVVELPDAPLKACWRCGKEALYCSVDGYASDRNMPTAWAICRDMSCMDRPGVPVDKWQSRPIEDAQALRIKELEKSLWVSEGSLHMEELKYVALEKVMIEAIENCETCKDEKYLGLRCARCQTFTKLLWPPEANDERD